MLDTTRLHNIVLSLKIDNFDKLPDGSPLEYSVDRRGFDFGRDQHLDWTLPDKNRVVSGKHCEVRYYEDAYWLIDTSTNGTFLNDSAKRVQSPYRLKDGDKLAIGDYVVMVTINLEVEESYTEHASFASEPISNFHPAPFELAPKAPDNIWETSGVPPPPIDARHLMPPQLKYERVPDFLSQAAMMPPIFAPEPIRKPNPYPVGNRVEVENNSTVDDQFSRPEAVVERRPPEVDDFAIKDVAPSTTISSGSGSENEFINRFAQGAGIPIEALGQKNAGDLAEQAGQLLNIISRQLMGMLHARAEAKALSRSGNRTLIQSADNNPLKFMPTPEDALKTMLSPPSRGYLDAKTAFESAFSDLKQHQLASLAAMQSAAATLFEDLSPEQIEKSLGAKKSILGGGKSKQWDAYATRWASKVGTREHGMLGAFLELFAEHYDKLSKRK